MMLSRCVPTRRRLLGNVLRAVSNYSVWRNHKADALAYLSSTCCRVGNKVLRCYDHRVWHTERSPLFYRDHQDIVQDVYKAKSEAVCCFGETDLTQAPLDMGWDRWDDQLHQQPPHNIQHELRYPRSDFWEKRGALLVISVPFIPGSHRAASLSAFLPVLEQLDRLHARNLVFGDVRGLNVIFTDNRSRGTLIDFDLCGRAGVGRYPEGYRHLLEDGRRRNVAGQPLQCWHDIDALVGLIFDVHFVSRTDNDHIEELFKIQSLKIFWNRVDKAQGPSTEELQVALTDLRDILSSKYLTLKPDVFFRELLRDEDDRDTVAESGATGSSPKKRKTDSVGDHVSQNNNDSL